MLTSKECINCILYSVYIPYLTSLIICSRFLDIANWTDSASLVKSAVKHFNEVGSACLSIVASKCRLKPVINILEINCTEQLKPILCPNSLTQSYIHANLLFITGLFFVLFMCMYV